MQQKRRHSYLQLFSEVVGKKALATIPKAIVGSFTFIFSLLDKRGFRKIIFVTTRF